MAQFVRRHRIVVLGAVLIITVTAFLAITGPGSTSRATLGDMLCTGGSGTASFTPGVKIATQAGSVGVTGNLGSCISLSIPAITGGTFVAAGAATGNCVSGGSASAIGTVTWSNATQSTFTATLSLGLVLGIPTMRGESHVTGGPFTGDLGFTLPLTAGFNPADCATPTGLTTATFANATTAGL